MPGNNSDNRRGVLLNTFEEDSMQLTKIAAHRHGLALAAVIAAVAPAIALLPPGAGAQTKTEDAQPGEARPTVAAAPETVQTFFLTNASEQGDFNDVQTALRNVLPRAKIYGIQAQDAITIRATAEDIEIAQKLIADLDQPRKLYRLTYTITDIDGGKRSGSQQFALLVRPGEKSAFKQGSRVPIVTGTYDGQPPGTQVQYQDIGLSISAQVNGSPDSLTVHTKIEESSLGEEKSVDGTQDPVVLQTVFDESSVLSNSKPLVLGSVDLPGTTQSQEIKVVAELVR
jgi:type II secretory pathway component GspD/PulD (secretin)